MVTDRRPARGIPRQEYDQSAELTEIAVPGFEALTPFFALVDSAREAEARAPMTRACEELLRGLAAYYGIAPPTLKLLGVRPHRTREGLLSYELFGDYHLSQAHIRLWTQTAMVQKWTSSRTLLSTLCHEFMHHLDVVRLGFPRTYHTTGFFERSHRLYLGVIGHAYYPLAWQKPERSGKRAIDWPETNRRRVAASLRPS